MTWHELQRRLAAGEPAPQLTVQLAVHDVQLDAGARTITGTVARYGELIPNRSMLLEAGSLQPRQPLDRVKLLRDHDHGDPIGYMTEWDAESLQASFTIPAGANGDRAMQEATDKLRDGLSVGFAITRYDFDAEYVMHVREAELYEISLVAVPAIASAGVTHVAAATITPPEKESTAMNRAQLAAALAAGSITQAEHDRQLAALDTATPPAGEQPAVTLATTAPAPAEPADEQLTAEPQPQPIAPAIIRDRALSFNQVVQRLTAAASSNDPERSVQLALNAILPSADAGEGFLRDDWIGELFRASDERRPVIDAIGTPQQLTAYKGAGWAWKDGESPQVAEYTGGDTATADEVASNPVSTIAKTFTAFDIAAAWEIKRRFVDFANPEFTAAFWRGIMRDYKRKSNTGVRTRVLAAATAPGKVNTAGGGTPTVAAGGVTALIKQVARDVRKIEGGRLNRVFLASNLMEELENYPTDNLPMWLAQANIGMDFEDGRATISGLAIVEDSTLAAGQLLGFDNRALMVRERTPLELEALNIPRGMVQLGFYSYLRLDDHDPRLIVKRTYGETQPV